MLDQREKEEEEEEDDGKFKDNTPDDSWFPVGAVPR